MEKKIILLVCRGNIARSPIAAAMLNKILHEKHLDPKYIAVSRGVQGTIVDPDPVKFPNIMFYEDLYKEVFPSLQEYNIDLS